MPDLPPESATRVFDRAVFCDVWARVKPGHQRAGCAGTAATRLTPRWLQLLLRPVAALQQAAHTLGPGLFKTTIRHDRTCSGNPRLVLDVAFRCECQPPFTIAPRLVPAACLANMQMSLSPWLAGSHAPMCE